MAARSIAGSLPAAHARPHAAPPGGAAMRSASLPSAGPRRSRARTGTLFTSTPTISSHAGDVGATTVHGEPERHVVASRRAAPAPSPTRLRRARSARAPLPARQRAAPRLLRRQLDDDLVTLGLVGVRTVGARVQQAERLAEIGQLLRPVASSPRRRTAPRAMPRTSRNGTAGRSAGISPRSSAS